MNTQFTEAALSQLRREHYNATVTYPQPTGVIELLERLGFQADEPRRVGNIHFEKYW